MADLTVDHHKSTCYISSFNFLTPISCPIDHWMHPSLWVS
uniref:Uncharacterized protein n=1 Tax=Arundo donax TaxID=35708 RepID=A0A0A8Y9F4_ARUDO